jgi:hypothetical protein
MTMSSLILDLFFLTTLVQGAIRKWVAPGLSLEIELFRDVLPVLALIICYQQPHLRRQLGRFTGRAAGLFWAYVGVAVFEACSPSLPVFVVLVGIRTHFAYLPLALLMPIYLKSWPHGLRKLRQLLALAVPIFLLAFFQNTQPAGSVWNRYADSTVDIATFGVGTAETVRATGTFAYLSEFANFAGLCALITLFLMLVTNNKIIGRVVNSGILIMALGGIMASGSRGPAAIFGAQILGLAALGYRVRAIAMRHLFPLVAFTLLALALSVTVLERQATDFLIRAQATNEDVGGRVDRAFFEWLDVAYEYPLGVGLGAGHQAFYAEMAATATPNLWESELSRLAFELGLGILLYIAFKVALVAQFLSSLKAMRTRAGRVMLATGTITLTPLLVTGSVYPPVTNVVFWAFVGVGFWVIKLEIETLPARWAAAPVLKQTATAGRPRSFVGECAQ